MSRELDACAVAERSIIKKYRKVLWNPFIAAVKRYELIAPGDKIAVCISGGKDSMLLAKLMQELLRHTEQPFGLVFLVMDPGYAPQNRKLIEENAELLRVPIQVFESNIFEAAATADRKRLSNMYPSATEQPMQKKRFGCPMITRLLQSLLPKRRVLMP